MQVFLEVINQLREQPWRVNSWQAHGYDLVHKEGGIYAVKRQGVGV